MSEKNQNIELGWPKIKRELAIEAAFKDAKKQDKKLVHKLEFQGKTQFLPILSVPFGMPKYRIANRRLRAAQVDYQIKNKLPKTLFSEKNEEDNKSQFHQHQLLKEVIGAGDKNLGSFFKENDQDRPYILTKSGIIINGNRRTCALRELVCSNPKKYNNKKMIDVVVLPACTDNDIDELEYKLQFTTDIHQNYEWYEVSYSFAYDANFRQQALHKDPKAQPDINLKIQSLKFGEKYLLFLEKPNRYKELKDHEEACRTWIKVRNKYKGANRELIPYVENRIFQAMQNPKGGRVYSFVLSLGNVERVKASVIQCSPRYKIPKPKSDEGLLKAALKISNHVTKLSKDESDKDIELYREDIDEATSNEKTRNQSNEVLILVDKGLTNLRNALSVKNRKSSTKGLNKKLEAVIETVKQLSQWLR